VDDAAADAIAAQATLCTVLTPAHVELGALNAWLVERLNPGAAVRWSVTCNPDLHDAAARSPARASAATRAEIARAFPGADLHEGPPLQQVFEEAFADPAHAGTPEPERRRLLGKYLGSYHHAAGLRRALAAVRTRYAVVIDPDLYVIRPRWIGQVLAHMAREDLAVFGVPWSPRWYQKYRGFPCTHLMVVDLHRAPFARELLAPDLVGGGRRFASELLTRYAAAPRQGRAELLRRPWRALAEDLRQRASIGSARDTGYGLMQAFRARGDLRVGLAQAVFAPEDGFMPPAVGPLQRNRFLEALLPDRKRYLPRGGAWTRRGFADFGYPSMREHGWEEFLWEGAPFAVHVRGELQRRPGRGGVDPDRVRAEIEGLLARVWATALEITPSPA
jgi:hypothetical protein